MSLMIKGVDMPRSGESMTYFSKEIIEIPRPHGRLIDADALVNRIKNNYCNKCTAVEECGICVCQNCGVATLFDEIENATTIIEAEVSE